MITVMCPTRARPARLRESVDSLLGTASNPDDVEILLAIDPDDVEVTLPAIADTPGNVRAWIPPERYGYLGLHRYFNHLASTARGSWLLLWNDDARMTTPGWDAIIGRETCDQVLWPEVNHDQGGNLFPVWPRAWSRACGHVSLSANVDVWISEVGRRAGAENRVGITIFHDRPDVTGSPVDEVFLEGRALMGSGNEPGYASQENTAMRSRDVRVIKSLLANEMLRG